MQSFILTSCPRTYLLRHFKLLSKARFRQRPKTISEAGRLQGPCVIRYIESLLYRQYIVIAGTMAIGTLKKIISPWLCPVIIQQRAVELFAHQKVSKELVRVYAVEHQLQRLCLGPYVCGQYQCEWTRVRVEQLTLFRPLHFSPHGGLPGLGSNGEWKQLFAAPLLDGSSILTPSGQYQKTLRYSAFAKVAIFRRCKS